MTLIALPYSPVDGDPEDISEIMADFNAILAVVNGELHDDNVAADAAIASSKIVLDVDGTLTANSDTVISSQKATKTYADAIWTTLNRLTGSDLTVPGWVNATETWVYVSASSFKVVGADVRTRYPVGTKLSCTDATTTKYFYVAVTPTYAAGDTTITITDGAVYSLSGGAITNPRYSYMSTPYGFTGLVQLAASVNSGWSVLTADTHAFSIANRKVTWYYAISGTSNATGASITTPFTILAQGFDAVGYAVDNGIRQDGAVDCYSLANNIVFRRNGSTTGFTNSGDKSLYGQISFQI